MKLLPYYDVILVKKSKSIWSGIIKFFLKQKYTHSEYVISDWLTCGTDLSRPVSIMPFGYNITDIDIYRLQIKLTDKQKEIIIEFLQKATKIKYDWLEAVCVGLGIPVKSNKKYICISLVVEALENASCLPKGIKENYKGFDIFTKSGYFKKI